MAQIIEQLKECPYPDSDSCEICPRLYFWLDNQREFDRQCRRYPSVDAQKQAIRDKYPGHQVRFDINPFQRQKHGVSQHG